MLVDITPQNLEKLRKDKGWSRKDAADKLGCSDNLVAKWEQGDRIPSLNFFYEMSDLYNVEFIMRSAVKHPKYNQASSPGDRE